MGILEWFALHLPSWVVNLFKAWFGRPRPDVRILSLERTGGSHGRVDFQGELANYGTQPCRVILAADVNGEQVTCSPAQLDLQPNASPTPMQVYVQRPTLGDLVKALNDETTLYGATLRLQATGASKKPIEREWTEEIPDQETDRARYDALMEAWAGRPQGHV